jgi:DNA-directed RNA polymerase alpha subunit
MVNKQERDEFISSFENRIQNALGRQGVFTKEQLLTRTEIDLSEFTNLGWTSIEKIVKALKREGLQLGFDPNQKSKVSRKKKPSKMKMTKKFIKDILSV